MSRLSQGEREDYLGGLAEQPRQLVGAPGPARLRAGRLSLAGQMRLIPHSADVRCLQPPRESE